MGVNLKKVNIHLEFVTERLNFVSSSLTGISFRGREHNYFFPSQSGVVQAKG